MKRNYLRKISALLAAAIVFSTLSCIGMITASADSDKVFTFKPVSTDITGFTNTSNVATNYDVTYGTAEYDGAERDTADFTLKEEVGDSLLTAWNNVSQYGILYFTSNWSTVNLANYPSGYVRLWINSPKAMPIVVGFQENGGSYNYYTTGAEITSAQVGKLSYVDIPLSSFHKGSGNFDAATDPSGEPPACETRRFVVTCAYSNATWIDGGQTITVGNVEIWDGVPTTPAGSTDPDDPDDGDYGSMEHYVPAIEGIVSADNADDFSVIYSTNADYNGTNDNTAAQLNVLTDTPSRVRLQVNPRSEAAGWQTWYLKNQEYYLRLWVNVSRAVTLTVTVQESSSSYKSANYTASIGANKTGRFIAVDIPLTAFASLQVDDTSRINKIWIIVTNADGSALNSESGFSIGQVELWDGRPTPPSEGSGGSDDTLYTVTTKVENGQHGTATVTNGSEFKSGEKAHLLADAASGYHFVKWVIDGAEYTENPLDYAVYKDVTATAVFEADFTGEAECLLTVSPESDGMKRSDGGSNAELWYETPEFYTVATKTYAGAVGKFTVRSDIDMSTGENGFYCDWLKSRTLIAYTINNYSAIDYGAYASYGVLRVWVCAEKAMKVMVGVKTNQSGTWNYSQICVQREIPEAYVGKFIPLDIPFSELVSAGWAISSDPAVEVILRRTDDANADNGYFLLGGESVELGAAEIWTAQPETPDLNEEIHLVTVDYDEAAGTVTGEDEYEYGKEATLTAQPNPGYSFAGWLIGGKLLTGTGVTVTVNSDLTVKAIFRAEGESLVTFEDQIGRIVDAVTVKTGGRLASSEIPAVPQRYGYTTTGWDGFDSTVKVTADLTVKPAFQKTGKVSITVENGRIGSDTSGSYDFEESVTATCDAPDFSYWAVDGVKVSDANPYTFYAAYDMTLTAVCGAENSESNVYLASDAVVTRQEDGLYSVTVFAGSSLAEGAELKDAGFIMASGDQRGKASSFMVNSIAVKYSRISIDTGTDRQFMLTLTNIPGGTVRSLRAYAVVTHNGTTETLHSSVIVKAKATDGTEETALDYMVLNSDFLNGLTEDEVMEFCENGWFYQPENNDRLIAAMQKAQRGETVTIAFLGGSITTGSNSGRTETSGTDGSSREKLLYALHRYVREWWEQTFPQATINYVVAGEAGTGSTLAVYRMKYQVLAYEPDVVFNDSAANEGGADLEKECYESVLRSILSLENAPAVIDLGMAHEKGTNAQGVHKTYCEHYGVPIVSYQDSIKAAISAGQVAWSDLSNDNVHPNQDGHRVVGDLLNYYLSTVYMSLPSEQAAPEHSIPAPLTQARFTDAELFNRDTVDSCEKIQLTGSQNISNADTLWGVPDMRDQPENHHFYSNQSRNQGWTLNGEGAYMEFTVTARECRVVLADRGNTTDRIDIYVDSQLKTTYVGDGSWAQKSIDVFENERGDSTHTVKIVVQSGAAKLAYLAASSWNG